MIELNKQHPDFSLELELLCLLPKSPDYAWYAELACDLGIKDVKYVHVLVQRLRRKFFLDVGDEGHGRAHVGIADVNGNCHDARLACEAYWLRVNYESSDIQSRVRGVSGSPGRKLENHGKSCRKMELVRRCSEATPRRMGQALPVLKT